MIGLAAVALAVVALVCVLVAAATGRDRWAVFGAVLGVAGAWVMFTNLPPVYGG